MRATKEYTYTDGEVGMDRQHYFSLSYLFNGRVHLFKECLNIERSTTVVRCWGINMAGQIASKPSPEPCTNCSFVCSSLFFYRSPSPDLAGYLLFCKCTDFDVNYFMFMFLVLMFVLFAVFLPSYFSLHHDCMLSDCS